MQSVAVLGASGVLGKAVVDELLKNNFSVKILVRDIEKYKSLYPNEKLSGRVNVVQGDLDTNQSLATVLEFVDTIFVCFSTEFHKWGSDMIRWIDRIADLAVALEARIVYPGCSHNFGIKSELLTEDHQQDSHTELGQLKIAVETRLYRAAQDGAQLTIVRLPDVYGPADFNSMIGNVFATAVNNKMSRWRGNIDIKHEFIYSIDAAKALIMAGSTDVGRDRVFHFSGVIIHVEELIKLIHNVSKSTIQPNIQLISKARDILYGLFSSKYRFYKEIRYLNENENFLSGKLFNKELGEIELTPFDDSIRETIEWYQFWASRTE
ncbi:MAG: NAD-dependent epimerase/dehydratase family protein [Candidatus Heimdallarchaeota archaeon]|nr:NAD-dependent epimerase/dehydratase family protein [Candidatus Heimdallarchaeota archaeon]